MLGLAELRARAQLTERFPVERIDVLLRRGRRACIVERMRVRARWKMAPDYSRWYTEPPRSHNGLGAIHIEIHQAADEENAYVSVRTKVVRKILFSQAKLLPGVSYWTFGPIRNRNRINATAQPVAR